MSLMEEGMQPNVEEEEEEEDMEKMEVVKEAAAAVARTYLGKGLAHWALICTCCLMIMVGVSGGMLLGRLYFNEGGQQRWLYTTLQTIGWPMLVPLLVICYYTEWRKSGDEEQEWRRHLVSNDYVGALLAARAFSGARVTPRLIAIYLGIGFLTAVDSFLFAWGISYLPVSTDALLTASQLVFNALFSYALVRHHRFTAASLNAVFAITLSALLLGLHVASPDSSSSDLPPSTSHAHYVLAFLSALGAAALYGLILPLMELTYRKVILKSTFCVIMEAQTTISMFATIFSLLGMAFSGEFSSIAHEASQRFRLGPILYSLVLVGSAICWQLFFLGSLGLIFLVSSLLSCVLTTGMLPLLSILAILVFHDPFSNLKLISMVLSIWGLISYAYGGYHDAKAKASSMLLQQDQTMVA